MPRIPSVFQKIKKEVLGNDYDLSLAFLSKKEMLAITKRIKRENHISNVLSFPFSKNSGEILICPAVAKPHSLEFLFIHGLLHLKNFKHGARMESEEKRILKKYDLSR